METTHIYHKSNFRKILSNITVEPLMFCYGVGLLASFPTIQNLTFTKLCLFQLQTNDIEVCDHLPNKTHSIVEKETSLWMLYTSLAYELSAMITSLFWGAMSDIYGRKCFLLINCTLATISASLNVWFSVDFSLPMAYLVLSHLALGLGGGFNMVSALCMNYIHDITCEKDRTKRISIISAAICLGGAFGPIASGLFLRYFTYASVFLLTSSLYAACVLSGFILLKDITQERDTGLSVSKLTVVTEFMVTIKKARHKNQRRHLILLLLAKSLFNLSFIGVIGRVLFLYVRDYPLYLSASNFALFLGLTQFCNGVGSVIGFYIITQVFGCDDMTLSIIGLSSAVLGFIIWGLGFHLWIMFIGIVGGILGYLGIGGIQSMMSKILGKDEQGKVFALSATLDYISGVASPIIFNLTYPHTRGFFNGLCFHIAAFFLLGAIGCLVYIKWDQKKQHRLNLQEDTDSILDVT